MAKRPSREVALVRQLIDAAREQIGEAAKRIERNAHRMEVVSAKLENAAPRAQAQAVIDRLAPDVEELAAFVEQHYWQDDHALLRERVTKIARRLGVDD